MIRSVKTIDITAEGLRALRDRLGPSGMLAFLESLVPAKGDYTAERQARYAGQLAREVAANINTAPEQDSARAWVSELFRQAARVAQRDESDREEWLNGVATRLDEFPTLAEIVVSGLRTVIDASRKVGNSNVRLAHAEETLEAAFCDRLEAMLAASGGQLVLSGQSINTIALIAVVGHMLPNLRNRLQQADAQQLLSEQLGIVLARFDDETTD